MSCKAGQKHLPVRVRYPQLQENLPGCGRPAFPTNVRLSLPDMSAWEKTNSGVSGVIVFDSGKDGPDLVITGLVHGNEFAGGHALENLRKKNPFPQSGRLTLIAANLKAFKKFDITNPIRARYLDEDLNRLWSNDRLRSVSSSFELNRAKELLPFIERADLLLDLHSTLWPSDPLFITPNNIRSIDLAKSIAVEENDKPVILIDWMHQSGSRLIEHVKFTSPSGTGRACLLEAGLHWEVNTVLVMEKVINELLKKYYKIHFGEEQKEENKNTQMIITTDSIKALSSNFNFIETWVGNTCIPKAGTIIARDGDDLIQTPYDDCFLIIPNLRPQRGQLAVRLARRTAF
ncbi:M14 family metallopeptidase [Swingsia samuiensis]|uniref:Succinylglutamate desuccinylase/Aspartoacylase catalytic domain-containing protein n=1 Tax=Swingsia samuiensis TaxID=1293412 RepID=A0A4Y6UJW2_9PROT|nr:succinylglutamate desuccinylase/aspartoacylase family protein [Swingsia samuiensis]QDH17852.1 hypothetical protein E3D00_09925 [Swingsia samuiensis]